MELTEAYIKKECDRLKLYRTPHLNDKLYLHYKVCSMQQQDPLKVTLLGTWCQLCVRLTPGA